MTEHKKPELLHAEIIAQTRLFRVEALHLRFSNGVERHYERLKAGGRGAVMIVPLLNEQTLLLTREYAAGVDRYELAFPKGLAEVGETPEQAANRELMEEAGFGAHKLTRLKTLTLAPGYLSHRMDVLLAEDLYPKRLEGDEPEPIEVVPWSIDKIDELLASEEFSEARSIAALFLVRDLLRR
ncbi:ADP compounds hydrolase NudE [Permianibacter aggregans]|uniref:ADP-ribose diphosphatase n=1 Tax=Permianibacter aggregans TaxID=1510150 RepID=A0A4R6URK3_9GAMM|nr:ADP compounds hydrolase NudE [Permianibacter aggregans]QGX39560.1 ADP compounds hydrolase NudE [Permianibacter aggregans]TDQ49691.1 ADP-ribose diphosphatase [Permianibacter aggregans]